MSSDDRMIKALAFQHNAIASHVRARAIVKLLTVTFPSTIFVGLVFAFGVCAGHCILLLLKIK